MVAPKQKEKEKAVKLRKQGKTYSEILKEVPVAKSTLSLWLRDVGLAKRQKRRLTKKMKEASVRGGKRKREMRLQKTRQIKEDAMRAVGRLSKREKWLIGTALYWAEGTKQKMYGKSVSNGVEFANSDPKMIKFFLQWLTNILGISKDQITFRLFIHEKSRNNLDKVIKYWTKQTGFSKKYFNYVYFKKHNPKTKRKKTGENYFGLIAVKVKASTDLNRKISGWVNGIVE